MEWIRFGFLVWPGFRQWSSHHRTPELASRLETGTGTGTETGTCDLRVRRGSPFSLFAVGRSCEVAGLSVSVSVWAGDG
jgi:hypothetical protein